MNSWLHSLQIHEILIYGLVFGLPIVAIGFSFEPTFKALIRRGERLIMVEQGLDLDYYPEQTEVEDRPAPRPGDMDETQPYAPRRAD